MKRILFFLLIATSLLGTSPQYVIKGDRHYPPYVYLNKTGKPDGFSVELLKAIAKKVNIKIKIELDIWAKCREDLENGKIDAILVMFKTKERAKKVDFSLPYFQTSYRLFVHKHSKISSLKELDYKKLLLVKGEVSERYIKKNHPLITVIPQKDPIEAFQNYLNGVGDAVMLSHLQGITTLKKQSITSIQTLKFNIASQDISFAVKKGETYLLGKLEEGLSLLKQDGSYEQIYNKWFGVQRERNKFPLFKLLIFTLFPIFFIIGLIFLWNLSLKKQVQLKVSELKESKENLKIMFNSIGDGIIVTDIQTCITMMNPTAEKILGWKLEEIIGKELDEVSPNKTMPYKKRIESFLLHGKEVSTDNITIITRDQKEYDITFTSTPIRQITGEVHSFILVFRDITQELKLQEQLHRYSKLETIGELAGGVAHDFNNMLSGIMGAVQVINTLDSTANSEQKEYIKLIEQTIQRASSLTEKLLSFGRKTSHNSIPINFEDTLRDSVNLLKRSLHKNIKLNLSIQSSNNRMNGNKAALQNLLMNLAINAEYAMPKGGQLHITTRNYNIDTSTSKFTSKFMTKLMSKLPLGEYIEVIVSDTGTGIAPEHLDKIFDPFFTTKPKNKNIGLGLSSVYGIVQDHGGMITVKSERNKGTSFTILLPSLKPEKTKVLPDKTASASLKKGKASILVVDDEEIIRKTASHILKHLGYSVLNAENGIKAIDIIKQKEHDIDLVITDMMMPEMNGKELFLKVKEFNKKLKKEIKVVISSGFTKEGSIQELKQLGLSGFLSKPYIKSEMSELIEAMLQK